MHLEKEGPEPAINFFPKFHKDFEKKRKEVPDDCKSAAVFIPPDSPEPEDKSIYEWKEEIALMKTLSSSDDKSEVLRRLDVLLDRKWRSLYQRITILEKEHEKAKRLLQDGVKANDPYWAFDNWRDIRHYGAVAGMAARCYAMVFDAIDYNNGVLRETQDSKRRRRPE